MPGKAQPARTRPRRPAQDHAGSPGEKIVPRGRGTAQAAGSFIPVPGGVGSVEFTVVAALKLVVVSPVTAVVATLIYLIALHLPALAPWLCRLQLPPTQVEQFGDSYEGLGGRSQGTVRDRRVRGEHGGLDVEWRGTTHTRHRGHDLAVSTCRKGTGQGLLEKCGAAAGNARTRRDRDVGRLPVPAGEFAETGDLG